MFWTIAFMNGIALDTSNQNLNQKSGDLDGWNNMFSKQLLIGIKIKDMVSKHLLIGIKIENISFYKGLLLIWMYASPIHGIFSQ